MTIALVQQASNQVDTGTSVIVTLPAAPQPGNCLVGFYTSANVGLSSVSGGGVTWGALRLANFDLLGSDMFYGLNSSGSGTAITFTLAFSGRGLCLVAEFSGVKPSAATDVSNQADATSSAPAMGSLTPTAADSLILYNLGHIANASPSAGPTAGFTALAEVASGALRLNPAYLVQGAAAAVNPGWTLPVSANWESTGANLLAAPAAVASGGFIGGGFF